MGTKKCPKCGRVLPVENFSKSKNSRDGLQCYCKECKAEYNKKYWTPKGSISVKNATPSASSGTPIPNPKLAEFHPRELIEELRARNYKGKLYITREIIV